MKIKVMRKIVDDAINETFGWVIPDSCEMTDGCFYFIWKLRDEMFLKLKVTDQSAAIYYNKREIFYIVFEDSYISPFNSAEIQEALKQTKITDIMTDFYKEIYRAFKDKR